MTETDNGAWLLGAYHIESVTRSEGRQDRQYILQYRQWQNLERSELWLNLSKDLGKSWSEPHFIIAQAEKVDASGLSVKHDVSYVDLLVDCEELNLFVGHGQIRTVLVKFNEKDLCTFYTKDDLRNQLN